MTLLTFFLERFKFVYNFLATFLFYCEKKQTFTKLSVLSKKWPESFYGTLLIERIRFHFHHKMSTFKAITCFHREFNLCCPNVPSSFSRNAEFSEKSPWVSVRSFALHAPCSNAHSVSDMCVYFVIILIDFNRRFRVPVQNQHRKFRNRVADPSQIVS